MGKYDDIINLPHHVSKKHPQMSLEARSAQFAPFSPLTGYEEEIEETGRLTNQRKELNEEVKQILDNYGKKAPGGCPVCAHPQAYFKLRATNY